MKIGCLYFYTPEEFIGKSIVIKAGELTGQESGISVREYQESHRGLQQTDVEFFTRLLARVLYKMSNS